MSLDPALARGAPLSDPTWSGRLGGWLLLARISNSPTVVSNVLAGAALGGGLEVGPTSLLLVLAMVLFYTAGMLLNDVCDERWDREHRAERPLVTGLVSRRAAGTGVVLLLLVGLMLLWRIGPASFLAGLVLIGLIVLYDAWHKANPLSPLVMAGCRLLVYVVAFLAFRESPTGELLLAGALLVVYMVGLTAIAKSETRPSVSSRWPAVLPLLPALAFGPRLGWPAGLLALGQAGWSLYSLRFAYRTESRDIGGTIGRLIAGISLLDALVLVAAGASPGLVAVALVCFVSTLLLQRMVPGT
jgi:4-hydroxybenzoate polyprenyltransferase